MKYECPHCHEKTISLAQKAMAGSLTSKGATCEKCGRRSVNGLDSTIFRTIVSLITFAFMIYLMFFSGKDPSFSFWASLGALALTWVLIKIFDAFFAKLVPSKWI